MRSLAWWRWSRLLAAVAVAGCAAAESGEPTPPVLEPAAPPALGLCVPTASQGCDGSGQLDLGTVRFGDQGSGTVELRNSGPGPLELVSAQVTAPAGAELFAVTVERVDSAGGRAAAALPETLEAQSPDALLVTVTFQASIAGLVPAGATLVLETNDPAGARLLPITGRIDGCPPGLADLNGQPEDGCESTCVPDGAELCDGRDNDCNQFADDGDPGGGAACASGMPGACAAGTERCQGGAIVCRPDSAAVTETCNNVDDDCDGDVDDGDPGGGVACATGQQGVCAAGATRCAGGSLQCARAVDPSPERCGDGIDQDCSGGADPACPPNDACAGAVDISAGGLFTVDATFATADVDVGCDDAGGGGRDVVFTFTLGARERIYLDTFGSGFDTVISLRQGTTCPGTEVTCQNDAACGNGFRQSQLTRELDAGTYFVVVKGFGAAAGGTVQLRFARSPCLGSIALTASPTSRSGNTCQAGTTFGADPTCAGGGKGDVYFFTECPGSHAFAADTCDATTTFDSVVRVAADSCADAGVCNDDQSPACASSATASGLTATLTRGGIFYVVVNGFNGANDAAACGAYKLDVSF